MPTRRFAVASLAALAVPCLGAKAPSIPRQTVTLNFTLGQAWPEPVAVKDRAGRPAYYLRLEMDESADMDDPMGVELVLARGPADEDNLLEPGGVWHGYMDFLFMGWDYPAGPDASVYGRTRHIRRNRAGLSVDVTVVSVSTRPNTPYRPDTTNHGLTQLTLRVEVGP